MLLHAISNSYGKKECQISECHQKNIEELTQTKWSSTQKSIWSNTWHSSKLCLFSSLNCMLLSRSKFNSLTWKKNSEKALERVSFLKLMFQNQKTDFKTSQQANRDLKSWVLSKTAKIKSNSSLKTKNIHFIWRITWSWRDFISSSENINVLEFARSVWREAWAFSAAFRAPSSYNSGTKI